MDMAAVAGIASRPAHLTAAGEQPGMTPDVPTLTVERITPELATQWLDSQGPNRSVAPGVVARYVRAMQNGQWRLNGEAIKFGKTGRLVDGQHRLHAVANCGFAIDLMVVRGVDDDAFDTIDAGRPRVAGDSLTIAGHANGRSLAAALTTVLEYQQRAKGGSGWRARLKPTAVEVHDAISRHPQLDYWVTRVGKRKGALMPPALLAGLLYLAAQHDERLAERFADAICTNLGVEDRSPVWLLRERLQTLRGAPRPGSRISYRAHAMALFVKAWNATREDRQVQLLRWGSNEDFPTLK